MKLICDTDKGGCGHAIDFSKQVLVAFWEAHQQKRELDCPNDGCNRKVSHEQISAMVKALTAISKKAGTKKPTSGHLRVRDVPNPGRAYGQGRA